MDGAYPGGRGQGQIVAEGQLTDLTARIAGGWEARLTGDVDAVVSKLTDSGMDVRLFDGGRLAIRGVNDPRPLFRAALDAGGQIRELKETTGSLEDAFLKALKLGPSDGGEET